jgi:hypothetical protein
MTQYLFSLRMRAAVCGVFGILIAGLGASPALAAKKPPKVPISIDTTACATPAFSQAFLSYGDLNWYTLAPGQTVDSFDGTGWSLSGGAQIQNGGLVNGSVGKVLDLPAGSKAVSPTMCVNAAYTAARTMVRNVKGKDGVSFFISYQGTKTEIKPHKSGDVRGKDNDWTLSKPLKVDPDKNPGWQLVKFSFVAKDSSGESKSKSGESAESKTNETQISNFYVDPRMK